MNGRDWRDIARNAVPAVLWLITLAGMVVGVVALVALIIGG